MTEPVVATPPAAPPAAPAAAPAPAPVVATPPSATGGAGTSSSAAPWMAAPAAVPPAAAPAAPAAAAKPAEATPNIELKVPDGFKVEPDALGKYASFAKENGLSQAQTQKLLERDLTAQKASSEATQVQLKQQDQAWLSEIQTGWGAKFAENSEFAKRGFDILDPDGSMRKAMEQIGVGHWPKMVHAAERLGRMAAEDKLHAPNAGKTVAKMTPEEKLEAGYRVEAKKK